MGGSSGFPGSNVKINGNTDNRSDKNYRYYGNGGYYGDTPGTIPYGGGYGSNDFFDDELEEFFRSFGLEDDIFGDFFDSGYGERQPDNQL